MAKHRIVWDEAGTAGQNARAQLPAVVGRYFRSGRKLLRAHASPQELHAFRLKTKRLRYTLELFRTCYGSALEQRLEELRTLQTILGDVNDCAAALKVAGKALSARSVESQKLTRYLNARSARLATTFRKHWREEFDAPGKEEWWTGGLAR
jgi:CHAD domain-containing protein